MLRDPDLTLRQTAPAWEAAQVFRGLTQGQALQSCQSRNISMICCLSVNALVSHNASYFV
jgi:hypothetical protein